MDSTTWKLIAISLALGASLAAGCGDAEETTEAGSDAGGDATTSGDTATGDDTGTDTGGVADAGNDDDADSSSGDTSEGIDATATDTGGGTDTVDSDVVSDDASEAFDSLHDTSAAHSFRAELTWETPGDSNRSDTSGSDLTLHIRHPNAIGVAADDTWAVVDEDLDDDGTVDGWFSEPWDGFSNYDWDWSPAEGDDLDGWGPENRVVDPAEDGLTYRIGVDNYDDHGFGGSTAQVRIYIDGELVQTFSADLAETEFWEVADVSFPSGDVVGLERDGAPRVTTGVTPAQR